MAASDPTTEPAPRVRTTYLLVQAYFALRTQIEEALKPLGLTGLQLTILSLLKGDRGLSSAELSRHFYVTPQAMGQLLNGLAARGLISRSEDPKNRRILRLSLTPEGRRLTAQGDAQMREVERINFAGVDAGELAVLRRQLHQLAAQPAAEAAA